MTQAVFFMGLVPVSLLLVFGLVFVSGRLSAGRRRLLEQALLWGALAVLSGVWAWQSYVLVRLGTPLVVVVGHLALGAVVMFGIVRSIRKRRSSGTQA